LEPDVGKCDIRFFLNVDDMEERSATRSARVNPAALLDDISLEVSSHDVSVVEKLKELYPADTCVFVPFIPGGDYRETVNVAIAVQRAGFRAVPHVAVRSLARAAELDDFLGRITGEAGIDHVLLIGGDPPAQVGPFGASIELIRHGNLTKFGIKNVALAGHPEGHPVMKGAAPIAVLREKVAAARAGGLAPMIVTQFAFEAEPIVAWLAQVRQAGIDVPVRIGIAGPASIATLMKFAVRCGVGNSLRALTKRPQSFGKLLTDNTPDALIDELAKALGGMPGPLPGLHLFPFGGVAKAAKWLASRRGT